MTTPPEFAFLSTPEDRLLRGILRGDAPSWPAAAEPAFERRFVDACTAQGMAPLVHHRRRSAPERNGWPEGVRDRRRHTARMQTADEILRERELVAVPAALAAAAAVCAACCRVISQVVALMRRHGAIPAC